MKTHLALKMYFEKKKQSTPGFSIRSVARLLELSPSFLSRMINGQKPIPLYLLPDLAKILDVEPELLRAPSKRETTRAGQELSSPVDDWTLTDQDSMQVLKKWYYLPILELTTLTNFDGSVQTIAKRLRLSLPVAELAVRDLLSLKLLSRENGRLRKTQEKIRFTSSKSHPLIRKFHEEMLEKGQQELRMSTSEESFEKRLISGITLSASPAAVQAAKKRLSDCLHQIANELTASPGSEVYQLSGLLFPLSKS